MERRQLFQLAAGIGVGALGADEPVRRLVHMGLGPHPPGVWDVASADHLHANRTRPAEQVSNDLLADLLRLERQVATTQGGDAIELRRHGAVLRRRLIW
ncbi:hypothetical protein ABGB17_05670 [Sphaerisporangium sp. B11E5]|uniref:hypothetical protein n=1 Tax=Sphaerisporangium sp. B11E5 TaxID=3153563 RepID=UPI00325C6937